MQCKAGRRDHKQRSRSRLARLFNGEAWLAGAQRCRRHPSLQAHAALAAQVFRQQAVQQQRLVYHDRHIRVQRAAQAAHARLLQRADHCACAGAWKGGGNRIKQANPPDRQCAPRVTTSLATLPLV